MAEKPNISFSGDSDCVFEWGVTGANSQIKFSAPEPKKYICKAKGHVTSVSDPLVISYSSLSLEIDTGPICPQCYIEFFHVNMSAVEYEKGMSLAALKGDSDG